MNTKMSKHGGGLQLVQGSSTVPRITRILTSGFGTKRPRHESSVSCQSRSPVEELGMDDQTSWKDSQSSISGSLGYSFTPGGLLVPYYIGVMGAMKSLGLMGTETPISGSSAGAIVSALIASGLDYKDCLEANKRLQLEILQKGTFQKLCEPLRNSMMDVLPADIHLRASGRVGIGVTVYTPMPTRRPMRGELLDEYYSKEDFVEAIVASCYIPYYLGPAPGIEFRGEMTSDGLPTNFFPKIVDSARNQVQKTVTVSAMPRLNRMLMDGPGVDISPDCRPRSERFSTWGYVQRGVLAYSLDDLELLASQGYEDASRWGESFLTERIRQKSEMMQQQNLY